MPTDLKYQLLAGELEQAIRSGRLALGTRLPSLRKLMSQRRVSLATVVTAYQMLEERGLIAARAKSGYFVVSRGDAAASRSAAAPGHARAESPVARVDPNSPDGELFPRQRLNRVTASVLRRHPHLATHYAHGLGLPKLRREIARRSADFGSFIRADELVVTNGATEGLLLAIRAVAKPGDSVALETPAHPLFLAVLAELHINVVELAVLPGQGSLLAALEQALARAPNLRACLLVPNFHPPTGALMSVSAKRALLSFAERVGLAIIEDDVYGELQHEGPRPPPLKAFDTSGAVIYVTSYSKSIAPGMRVGWIAAGRWRARIETSKLSAAVATAEMPQLVLFDYLNRGGHLPHLRRLRRSLRERALRTHDGLTNLLPKDCRWSLPQGGYFLWLELPPRIDTADLLARPTMASLPIMSGQRCSPRNIYGHCLRLNTSLLDETMIRALAGAIG